MKNKNLMHHYIEYKYDSIAFSFLWCDVYQSVLAMLSFLFTGRHHDLYKIFQQINENKSQMK